MSDADRDAALDKTGRLLLETIQQAVPLTRRPYEALGRAVGVSESDVLARLQRVRELGLISRISAIFDTRSLGYESVLVAAKVPADRVDAAAAVINEHPGVSHNYLRTAEYNLWFTLAVPAVSALGLEKTAARLAELSGATAYRLLPAGRVFKIGMKLALAEGGAALPADEPGGPVEAACDECRKEVELTAEIKAAILALQEDLAIEAEPFDAVAARHGLTVERMLASGEELRASGVMRRYAAVLRHRKVGFAVNCMTVWSVPGDRADEAGAALAGFREVTHCYLRPAWPDWPYNLYAMIHCRSEGECSALVEKMKAAAGIEEVLEVYSTKEYKKVRLQYFSPAFGEWERRYGGER